MTTETLSSKRLQGGCIEDCACNSGDKDYHPELKEHETHFFYPEKDVREFIKQLKERNNNELRFLPDWKALSKIELWNRLKETLEAFNKDINELAGMELSNG